MAMRQLELPMETFEEQFRRTAFNIIGRNQDDHVKNIGFLMDKTGAWSLSPAFGISYNYNPDGIWTSQHQMSMNAKRDGFTRADFIEFSKTAGLKRGRGKAILQEATDAFSKWDEIASEIGVFPEWRRTIANNSRLNLPAT